jgi:hypothetical protein
MIAGFVQVTKIDVTDFTKMPAIGVIISKSNPATCVVQVLGVVTGVYGALTAPGRYFAGSTGKPSLTVPLPPAGGVAYVQTIGAALDTGLLMFLPSFDMAELRGDLVAPLHAARPHHAAESEEAVPLSRFELLETR